MNPSEMLKKKGWVGGIKVYVWATKWEVEKYMSILITKKATLL